MPLTRRDFAKQAILAGGSVALGCATHVAPSGPQIPPSNTGLPAPGASGIEHIVVVTMENRSFDHFLGWMPGVVGKQAGLTFVDKGGVSHPSHSLSGDFTGCPQTDPDHSYDQSRIAYNSGAMDGFLRAGANDLFSIGYYGEADNPFYAALARNYTTCDHYFAAILGPTFPNRLFLYTGQTDRLTNTVAISSLPTIFDRLADANVSHNYYYSNLPFVSLWAAQYLSLSKSHDDFIAQAANGTLPAVSFVDPTYTLLDDGTGTDDHPHSDIRKGDLFLYDLFEAVANGPAWSSTVMVFNFDEWGGFFDHVAPPRATAANAVDTDIVGGKTLLGFRLPVVIASPFTRGDATNPRISSLVYDHSSVLKMIEWRWGLTPLTPRDASSDINNLAFALNFNQPQAAVPSLPKPSAPLIGAPCLRNPGGVFGLAQTGIGGRQPVSDEAALWTEMLAQAKRYGFRVG